MRTRTGCMTCRQRKLKCGEEKPTCANCVKARRTCLPASGITFRHQQNPSMNKNQESLKSFYGYKETFTKAAQWVPVSKDLTWIHTSNPYDDIEEHDREQQRPHEAAETYPQGHADTNDLSQADYSAFTEGLAALSAVASEEQYSNAPSSASMERAPTQNPLAASSTQQLEFILNPASRMATANHEIDPQLQLLDVGGADSLPYAPAQSPPGTKDPQS